MGRRRGAHVDRLYACRDWNPCGRHIACAWGRKPRSLTLSRTLTSHSRLLARTKVGPVLTVVVINGNACALLCYRRLRRGLPQWIVDSRPQTEPATTAPLVVGSCATAREHAPAEEEDGEAAFAAGGRAAGGQVENGTRRAPLANPFDGLIDGLATRARATGGQMREALLPTDGDATRSNLQV